MAVDYAVLKKGGFMRQKQKNNFSLRLRVVGGNLTADQLAKVAEVAEKFGDGHVHLTSRQSVEIPFIKLEDIDAVKAALAEGGVQPGVCSRESAQRLPVRAMRYVPAAVSTHTLLQRRSTRAILDANFPASLNLVSQAVRITALKPRKTTLESRAA